jgi:hypothetical protein
VLGGAAGEYYTPGGQRDIDQSFLVMMNAYHEDIEFHLPKLQVSHRWECLIDTSTETGLAEPGLLRSQGHVFSLKGRSFALFIDRGSDESVAQPAMTTADETLAVIAKAPLDEPKPSIQPTDSSVREKDPDEAGQ